MESGASRPYPRGQVAAQDGIALLVDGPDRVAARGREDAQGLVDDGLLVLQLVHAGQVDLGLAPEGRADLALQPRQDVRVRAQEERGCGQACGRGLGAGCDEDARGGVDLAQAHAVLPRNEKVRFGI